ncbi:FAD:protein FMN transferase [Vannielia litorea]|uniref:FAD:protein FMN transferase n=1 Tax=Vannielia litorea TaxID=1217970 RepID=UPI001C96F199|nr:FAD:protein FMN transferase [Vannielia litorea]MBY6048319.1 FAD:protein FMN transferase [Vannielia litorea]MBY6075733.1 FAD:protein FMN transferase [Vannielia litorea]
MKRRRFLSITACFAALPLAAQAAPQRWRGRALGAEAEIVLHGGARATRAAFAEIERVLRAVEASFSLSDPASELSRLNREGSLSVSPRFTALMELTDQLHAATHGLFDPTVQPLWRSLFEGRETDRAAIGWTRVQRSGARVRLATGQALTFNGIAQGYATDLVAEALRKRGFGEVLVNIGEYAGHGGHWTIGLTDPAHGHLGTRTLTDGAIATSSPSAMQLGAAGHILHPKGGHPIWSTVSVEANSAALADGASTAFCLAPADDIRSMIRRLPGLRRVTLVDAAGNLTTL